MLFILFCHVPATNMPRTRNYDYGSMQRENVSMLSPWIRLRLLSEWEIINAVLQVHSKSSASKFIDEVCWRTYWKGWLELRPSVWEDYLVELAKDRERCEKYRLHSDDRST